MEHNNLISGKSQIKRVVGLEVNNDQAEVFVQGHSGTIESRIISNRFWILASEQINGSFGKLAGNLHFGWGRQYLDRATWSKDRSAYRNMGYDVYSIYCNQEALMVKDGICYFQDLKQSEVSLLSFDLETTGLNGQAPDAKIILISTTYRSVNGSVNKLFSFDEYKGEKEMIEAFCTYVREKNPSLILGHNVVTYDFPYLDARANKTGAKLKLGRDGSVIKFDTYDSNFRMDGTRTLEYKNVKIYGREIVDTYFLASAFDVSKSIESYALKPMIKQLGLEKDDRQHYDASLIRKNYMISEELEKIKQYAIDDAEDPVKLFDLMGPLYFNMATMMSKPFSKIILSASGSKINGMLVRAYLQQGHSIPKADEVKKFKGAISFSVPGVYSNAFKIDLAALYPSIQLEYEVCDRNKDPNCYILELIRTFRAKRLEYKKLAADTGDKYWVEMDTTAKGILNSFYGSQGAPGLNFNSFDCAEFITAKGREILEYTIKWASGKSDEEISVLINGEPEETEEEDASE